jgi:hypothetical protein
LVANPFAIEKIFELQQYLRLENFSVATSIATREKLAIPIQLEKKFRFTTLVIIEIIISFAAPLRHTQN